MTEHKDEDSIVEFNGHKIDTSVTPLARFIDGETGEPISDEQWDEQQRRLAEDDIPEDEIVFDDGPSEEEA